MASPGSVIAGGPARRFVSGFSKVGNPRVRGRGARCCHVLAQLKPDVAVNRQVRYQEARAEVTTPEDPVLGASSLPFRTPAVHSHSGLFPASRAATDVCCRGSSPNASPACQLWETGECISGTLLLPSLSTTEPISFPSSFWWKVPIAGIPATRQENKKTDASQAGSQLLSVHCCYAKGSSLKSK